MRTEVGLRLLGEIVAGILLAGVTLWLVDDIAVDQQVNLLEGTPPSVGVVLATGACVLVATILLFVLNPWATVAATAILVVAILVGPVLDVQDFDSFAGQIQLRLLRGSSNPAIGVLAGSWMATAVYRIGWKDSRPAEEDE